MSDVTITIHARGQDPETHRLLMPDAPYTPGAIWLEQWSPGRRLLDVWVAARRDKQNRPQLEVEISNSAVVIGTRSRPGLNITRIEISGAAGQRTIEVGIYWPRARALCFRMGAPMVPHDAWRRRQRAFGPCEMPLPHFTTAQQQAMHSLYTSLYASLQQACDGRTSFVDEGQHSGIFEPWQGPFAFWGQHDPGPGAPGGEDILHTRGWQGAAAPQIYAQYVCMQAEITMQRMYFACEVATGRPISVDHYTARGGLSPEYGCGVGDAAMLPEQSEGDSRRDPLDTFPIPTALSHYCRVEETVGAAAEITGSAMALRHYRMLVEQMRLQLSESGPINVSPSWTSQNLASQAVLAEEKPHQGSKWWGRPQGWSMWAAARARRILPSDFWTNGWDDWAYLMLDTVELLSMPTGLAGRFGRDIKAFLPETEEAMQSFEAAFLGLGTLALAKALDLPVPQSVIKAASNLYLPGGIPRGPYYGQLGPLHYAFVAPVGGRPYQYLLNGMGDPTIPEHPGDPIGVESFLACLYRHTVNENFFQALVRLGWSYAQPSEKLAFLEGQTDRGVLNWSAYTLSVLQDR